MRHQQSSSHESRGDNRIQFLLRALFKLILVVTAILTIGTLRRWRFPGHESLLSLWTLATLVPIIAVWAIDRLRLITPLALILASITLYGLSMAVPALSWYEDPYTTKIKMSFGWEAFCWSFVYLAFWPSRVGGGPFMLGVACLTGVGANIVFLLGFMRWRKFVAVGSVLGFCSVLLVIFASDTPTRPPLPFLHALYPGCGFWLASMLALWLGVQSAQQQSMGSIEATRDLISIGQLACRIQRSVLAIEQAADKLGIVPSLRLNGIPHFDGEQVEKLTEHFKCR